MVDSKAVKLRLELLVELLQGPVIPDYVVDDPLAFLVGHLTRQTRPRVTLGE
jgi:hypothetical protein